MGSSSPGRRPCIACFLWSSCRPAAVAEKCTKVCTRVCTKESADLLRTSSEREWGPNTLRHTTRKRATNNVFCLMFMYMFIGMGVMENLMSTIANEYAIAASCKDCPTLQRSARNNGLKAYHSKTTTSSQYISLNRDLLMPIVLRGPGHAAVPWLSVDRFLLEGFDG